MRIASTSKRVLITPLDWGLGHATRCIPVINEFLKQGCEVQIASSGGALLLLKEEFPVLKFHSIVSYNVKYSVNLPFAFKMFLQTLKFIWAIRREHQQINKIVIDEKIVFVISDNRYGCWSVKAKSIFIGHQLKLKTPIFSYFINALHQRAINKFSECWAPDVKGDESLSGELTLNINLKPKYIGHLSRMKRYNTTIRYQILVIISGPEPQRTIFEEMVLRELTATNKRCLVVRGIPPEHVRTLSDNLEVVNHLCTSEMNQVILESELIISRSGYSTIMDLAALGKKAIFVPTPGQMEQEYLANELMKKRIAFSMPQDNFNLQWALSEVEKYTGFNLKKENVGLSKTIERFINETN
jgi:uncharacterized protein (TIGR00661 family)